MARMRTLAERAEHLLGASVVSTTPVAGGDICTSTRLRLSDGRSALNVLTREANVDLLFSDVVMPGMTGIELANQVKDRFPAMKILLASGYPPPDAGDLKDFDFLPKPFSMADVAKKLRVLAR